MEESSVVESRFGNVGYVKFRDPIPDPNYTGKPWNAPVMAQAEGADLVRVGGALFIKISGISDGHKVHALVPLANVVWMAAVTPPRGP